MYYPDLRLLPRKIMNNNRNGNVIQERDQFTAARIVEVEVVLRRPACGSVL